MIAPYAGPRTFAAEYKRDELEKLAEEVRKLPTEANRAFGPLKPGAVISDDGASLRLDELNRVLPRAALSVNLPRVTAADAGRPLEVAVMSAAAAVTFVAVGTTVNGAASVTAATAVAIVRFRFDGKEWWT